MAPTTRAPRVLVAITEEIIAASKQRDSSHCMIAEAVKAAYPDARRVSVDLQTIRFSDPRKGLRFTYLTPRTAQVALVNYDQGKLPPPFAVQLRNGQVTPIASKAPQRGDLTDAQLSQRVKASRKSAQLTKSKHELTHGDVPSKIGGRTPPTTPFARRRAFGLRALDL